MSSEAPRPPLEICTCVWATAHAVRAARAIGDARKDGRVEAINDPLRIPLPDVAKRALGLASPPPSDNGETFSTPGDILSTAGARDDDAVERALVADRQRAKRAASVGTFATVKHADVPVRAIKKRFAKSMENKLRDLISAREDVVSCLKVRKRDRASLT